MGKARNPNGKGSVPRKPVSAKQNIAARDVNLIVKKKVVNSNSSASSNSSSSSSTSSRPFLGLPEALDQMRAQAAAATSAAASATTTAVLAAQEILNAKKAARLLLVTGAATGAAAASVMVFSRVEGSAADAAVEGVKAVAAQPTALAAAAYLKKYCSIADGLCPQ